MDEMMADAAAVAKPKKKRPETKAFGAGLKAGLRKGLAAPAKGVQREKGALVRMQDDEAAPPVQLEKAPREKDALTRMQDEVRANLEAQQPMLMRHRDEWLTPELMQALESSPRLRAGLQNPAYAAALDDLRRNPTSIEKYKNDKNLEAFLMEFCQLMGGHFEGIAANQKGGDKDVEAVLANAELKALLLDPKTKDLMQECGDPRVFAAAMRDPAKRAVIDKLKSAGLVTVAQ